jgi:hypothetical protein
MLTSSAVDHGFEHLCGQTKYNMLTSSVVDHGFKHLCGTTQVFEPMIYRTRGEHVVFGLTTQVFEPMIYCTRGEHVIFGLTTQVFEPMIYRTRGEHVVFGLTTQVPKYNMLTSSAVGHGFEHLCGQTKYNIHCTHLECTLEMSMLYLV